MRSGDLRLDGYCCLVTGASQGLGRAFSLFLAEAGAKVALAARSLSRLEETKSLIEKNGGVAASFALDVRNPEQVKSLVLDVEKSLGPLRVLVNNSGVAVTRRLLEVTEKDWSDVLDTNLTGAWYVAQQAAIRMQEHGQGGSIINISSILGSRTHPGVIAYNASKAGLNHLTQQMAADLARHSIRVNALAPGYVGTEMNAAFFESPPGKALIARIPQGRLGALDDLRGPLLFLASEMSSYVTGQIIGVDGGHSVNSI